MQDYGNLEVIIGDDRSSDGDVEAFIQNIGDQRIKYFRNEKNLGANGNYRRMLEQYASGDYAIVLNADDYWTDENFIRQAMSIFKEDSEVVLVFGDVKIYLEGSDRFLIDNMHKKLPSIIDGNEFFINYIKGYSLPHLSCLYVRKLAINLDFYRSRAVSEDWASLLKLIQGKKLGYLDQAVGVLTRNTQNFSKSTNLVSLYQADEYIEDVFKFALKRKDFEKSKLDQWRFQMLKRHHIKWLIKLWFLDKEKIPKYYEFLQTKHPNIYQNIRSDIRYRGYLWIRKYPFLLTWIFRKILKQESFIADLLTHKTFKT